MASHLMTARSRRRRLLPWLMVVAAVLALGRVTMQRAANAPLRWQSVAQPWPPGIRVYSAPAAWPASGARAWYVDVDYSNDTYKAVPHLAPGGGREPGGAMARRLGASVAINGGYFDMNDPPVRTYSLVLQAGRVLAPNVAVVHRTNPPRAYPVTRSAFGFRADRTCDVAWVAQVGGALWAYPRPVPHTVATVQPAPSRTNPPGGRAWNMVDAIGGGPTLISDGGLVDTYENEVFFGSGFTADEPYSRAAIGYTRDNHLILFATDGRQVLAEQGLTLMQTALEMRRLGCVEAMNLDGGGSETLVVNGRVLNQNDGQERAVTSILAFVPTTPSRP